MDLVHRRGTDGQRRLRNAQIERQRGEEKTKAAVPGSWVRFPPSVGTARLRAPPIRGRVKSSLSGGDFEENAVMSLETRDAWSRHCYRVDPEQARTASRWLYLMAWKAAPAKKAVRARRWDYHTCDAGKALIATYFEEFQELHADPAPRPGSWSAPKNTLMTMTREKNYFSTPISRMKENKGVLESPRADLDDRLSSF